VLALQARRGGLAGEDIAGWSRWFEDTPR
jgi:hypothetical protein